MLKKANRPRLSKGILDMKFMKRTKDKVDKEAEEDESRAMYASELEKLPSGHSNIIIETSVVSCEELIEGRLSFRGMNPELERLLELEQLGREAAKGHEQGTEVSDQDMASFYYANQAPATCKAEPPKFQTKNNYKRKSGNDHIDKRYKFQKKEEPEA